MFKIESYVTPILLSYVDKYVRDFKPADAQVSLWGGGVALHNLVLKADVLQREVALPFTLVSGRIHELLIQVPWTKIMSEPIVVTIDTIECVLSLNRPVATPTEEHVPESPRRKSPPIEAPPGYMQALVRRIVTNIALRVHHLIVKYVQDDIVLSLNVKHLAVDSAGADWLPAFADIALPPANVEGRGQKSYFYFLFSMLEDIDQAQPEIRRLVRLDDLTLCLDKADADGKIRFYQEPLLYRCQLDFRIVSKLQSAMTRRATGLSVQLRASRLAWGVTGDQLTMLLRLLTERALVPHAPPAPASNTTDAQTATNIGQSSSAAEPSRTESWSEWAWSWLPSTTDRDPGVASAPGASVTPLPLHFAAYFDDISLMFKIMESDSNNRKRSRGVLELSAKQTALKSYICKPTTMRIRFGTRTFTLTSQGKCICGHMGYHALLDEPTMYIQSRDRGPEEEWVWPDDELNAVEEVAQAVDEQFIPPPEPTNDSKAEQHVASQNFDSESERKLSEPPLAQKDDGNEFWNKMAPQVYVEYIHERSPPRPTTNPYDNPPDDFEYSDWVEECDVKVRLKPMTLRFSMGLLHRIEALNMILKEIPPLHLPDPPMRILTVEECEALTENLPQRRISIEIEGLLVRARPYDHVLFERPTVSPLVLDVELPNINLAVTGPLYPHRVCVAASQLPDDAGALWQGARLHVALHVEAAQALICSDTRSKARPCARASVHAVLHALLNKEYFIRRKSIELSFSVQISEASVCGSMSRLQAACQVASSLATKQYSAPLKCTSLAADALNDEESVAVDVTLEELLLRGYLTRSTTTYIVTLQATKATMLHEQKGSVLKQAWLFSAPDSHTNTHCLRLAVQYCKEPGGLEYAGAWTEPAAFAIDPLFLAWLAYRPTLKPLDTLASAGSMKSLSSSYFIRKRTTITHTSSSGRGGTKSGSGAEVHVRGRSQGSSDLADSIQRPEPKVKSPLERFWGSEVLLVLHKRLQRMLVNVELGLTLVYVTPTTASAIDCATVRDAMERHAAIAQDVLAINLGRLSMFSNTLTNQIWNEIKHDGPTYAVKSTKPQVHESFPWKLVLADMSIYTFEVRAGATSRSGREGSLKSQLRNLSVAKMRTVLENVSSTLTVSLVTKQKQITQIVKQKPPKKEKELTAIETRVKYFTGGIDFKPTTLKEFVRGPSKRKRKEAPKEEKTSGAPGEAEAVVTTPGPLLSLGIHLHGDTPPLIFRLEQDQVHLVAAAIHCLTHIQTLLQRRPLHIPKGTGLKSKSFVRSAAGLDELSSPSTTTSEDRSAELIPIFEAQSVKNLETSDVKTFLWCQWVVSRITVIATSNQSKLALNVDDIISSVDVQTHYNQYKIQVASASVKHYTRSGSDEWTAGVLGGRVLEAREPTGAKEDTHFLGVTITQASVANLPASWKEELHPKLLERKRSRDSMWEIYATLAPLEAVIQPTILNQIISLVVEMSPKSFCPLSKEKAIVKPIDWPFCYVTAGGLRLLLTVQDEQSNKTEDDTFMFVLGKITVNPHPDNPICRRPINTAGESGWMNNSGALDGQQFELLIKHIGIRCAQFHQLVTQESTEQDLTKGTASENPALKWTQNVVVPNITPILHSLDMACVLAPALYVNDTLSCGPAVELNLVSDFALEISVDQLVMAKKVLKIMAKAFEERRSRNRLQSDTQDNLCPYAVLLMSPVDSDNSCVYESNLLVEDVKRPSGSPHGADSGIDFDAASRSQLGENTPVVVSKSVSIAFVEHGPDASEYLEVFVTMGTIELSLYTTDDGSALMAALRPPNHWTNSVPADSPVQVILKEEVERNSSREKETSSSHSLAARSAKSLTETVRHADIGNTKLEMAYKYPSARKLEGNLPLLHVTLNQPNLYYWRKAGQKSIQVSLFDAWVGLGAGVSADCWYAALLSTERGAADPVTDIPPALATLNVAAPLGPVQSATVAPGSVTVDVERPVMLEVSSDRLLMLKGIYILIKDRMLPTREKVEKIPIKTFKMKAEEGPFLYKLRRLLVHESIESVTLQTTQIGVNGSQGAAGWDSLSVQVSAGGRPERLVGRCLVSAAVVSAGPPGDSRHVVLQPLMIGGECEARWEAWRRVEGGLCGKEPTARVCVDLDCVELDLRPLDWEALRAIRAALDEFTADLVTPKPSRTDVPDQGSEPVLVSKASMSTAETASEQHFYKDDLRSGAFKIVSGGQLPMAYQVTLHNNSVSWRYPHPRTITRLVAFPLPGQDEETPCVLELFSTMLCAWEAHTYFSVPVGEPRELQLYLPMPDAVSAQMWRFRVLESEQKPTPFEFNIHRYMPRSNPMTNEACEEPILPAPSCGVTAEQLSGVVRVDSCFSPRLSPRLRVATRVASLGVYLHNSLPSLSGVSTTFEGYYVSKPLLRQHRVLALCARSATLRAQLASPAGALLLLHGYLSSDLLECSTGAMEHLVEECQIRAGLSLPVGALSRARVALSHVNVALDIPRLRTLQSLHVDWKKVIMANMDMTKASDDNSLLSVEQTEVTQEELEGRVSLWIHNTCASALRVGQEGTEEVVPLGPGARLAYRWRSPTAPKKLRFALVGPSTDWSWSTGIPFTVDHYRVRLNDCEDVGSCKPASVGAAYLYTSVEERGSRLCMRLAGRLCLANMLRFHLLYKVRARCNESNQWRTVCSSELHAETVGRTVICGAICEMSVKIKFTTNDTGWSGDIPLKECPKENVPWLVKVPCEGDLAYMSVWTRVVRARTDGRIMATVWPLYVLYSHLSLDTDVLVVSESRPDAEAPPLVQAAPGRGRATQILAPGTTAARHRLSFQYRNIDCPVTKEAVPLHYGMTETSVFDKRSPATSLEDVYAETKQWLRRCGRFADSSWPYSIVSEHWRGQWKPALLQPKCDVTVQYAAVRAGGGCSLEVQLRPVVIICNAAPIALTLRAHDAAPLCKLEPGMAISPPTAVLTKAFFISVEVGRETFVSGELCVSQAELGAYGAPAPGRVALHVPMEMAIHCNHKVALLTMHYEIKEEINVLGLTSTYMLINRLDEDILMSALALPSDEEDESLLKPSTYKVIEPTEPNSVHGTCVSKFWVSGRLWRGSDPAELRLFLYLALPGAPEGARAAPVRLAQHPLRRPLALVDTQHNSVAVVVTQVRVEGRWVVTVARDPCPQLLVVNRTRSPVAVAAPRHAGDPATSTTVPQQECAGTSWHCVVLPDQALHYSTPSYCLRYPPHVDMTPPLPILFLTFARILEGSTVGEWCAPVAGTEGEQLVQLANDETVKLLVRAHPHSTRLELRDVDHRDISASDIRRRLIGAFSSEDMLGAIMPSKMDPTNLKRTHAVDKLPIPAVSGADVPNPPSSGRATPGRVSQSGSSPGGRTPNEQTPFDGPVLTDEDKQHHPSTSVLYSVTADSFDTDFEQTSKAALPTASLESMEASNVFHGVNDNEWEDTASWRTSERLRLLATSVGVQLSAQADVRPLLALFLDRAAVVVKSDSRRTKTTISIADVQVDNLQYESGQYDFPVVASTRGEPAPEVTWPPLWSLFGERAAFATRQDDARALLRLTHDSWSDGRAHYTEISEVELRVGPLAVYVEDAYVTALVSLARGAARAAASPGDTLLAEERALRAPLRLRMLHLHPLDLTLTLHTAVRMYIALDQSPLRLSAFKMADVMTSPERLTHALTVHYLSAAILGAGWVVGGLELLGAPGALAARVGGATGGVRGVASAAAAALLRSLSAWAGSLARNLDLLAGDVEHARRAAAARRRPPQSLMAGLTAGITNFAINILGAVGGLAHHPVVGVAVGESDSGATALRRGLIGALAKPLSATADLVAYAGQGLLTQTGWDPVPQPRSSWRAPAGEGGGWRRHCVRWTFRLADQPAVAAFHALVDGTPLHLLLTHKYLMLAEAESERVLEMIEFKQCSVEPYEGQIILLKVIQRRPSKVVFESRLHDEADEDTVQISAAAMARVARYAGVEGARAHSAAAPGERRALQLLPAPGQALALHALLRAAIHHNSDVFFPLL